MASAKAETTTRRCCNAYTHATHPGSANQSFTNETWHGDVAITQGKGYGSTLWLRISRGQGKEI